MGYLHHVESLRDHNDFINAYDIQCVMEMRA